MIEDSQTVIAKQIEYDDEELFSLEERDGPADAWIVAEDPIEVEE